jgi:hypothetical protein
MDNSTDPTEQKQAAMSDRERERDVSRGGRGMETSGPTEQLTADMPSPGALVGITIPDPPEQGASPQDRAHSADQTGPSRPHQEPEGDEDAAAQ